MTITCYSCKGTCTGEVLKVQEKHFHINCFACKVCGCLLASGGYFMKNDSYYCSHDYHVEFGTKCRACGKYVEGRVVTALGHSYHPKCFACDRCKGEINSGTVVTYNDRQEILCQKCTDVALHEESEEVPHPPNTTTTTTTTTISSSEGQTTKSQSTKSQSTNADRTERQVRHADSNMWSGTYPNNHSNGDHSSDQINDLLDFSKVPDVDPATRTRMGKCAGCGEFIKSSQSLIALDRHWHLFCFTCSICSKLLTAEYMTKKDEPFCEPCYHDSFGVSCSTCRQFITGKVLEAGEKSFHPSCAFCCKCEHSFGEGEDMCVTGNDIWHLDCDRMENVESESSSESSRSRTQSFTSPSPTSSAQHFSSKLLMSRESSAGEPTTGTREVAVYPLKELQLIGSMRLPRDVNRTKLEQHLADEEFHDVFGMERPSFYLLQMWKQLKLKKRANLF